ncbi:MAG TPA: serine/threonine-protein kinase, partial [Polyangia bacterium]|nr:serine/threonine-protein kinase [Polyangia bacterium]
MDLGAVAFRGTTRFRLVRFLGRGGMGVVYEAFDELNAVPVALKLLPIVSPDMLLRFKREFRAVADVRHPNLVRLGELVSEGSQWFFTMELVPGIDLLSYVHGVDPGEQPALTPRLAADAPTPVVLPGAVSIRRRELPAGLHFHEDRLRPVLAQLARALSALHAVGAIHRDVKPSNVLVTAEGRAVLLDFGLVSAASIETTQSGAGTPEYMAPEQGSLQPVSAAADWYAFGVILFELLTGRLPFEGLPHEILYRKQHGRAPRVAGLAPAAPPDLAALCDRLLEAAPEQRATGAEVLATLAVTPPGSPDDAA